MFGAIITGSLIEQTLRAYVICDIFLITLMIGLLVLLWWAHRGWKKDCPPKEKLAKFNEKQLKKYKKSLNRWRVVFAVSLSAFFLSTALLANNTLTVYSDIQNKDYITYHGEYKELEGSMRELCHVLIPCDESGKTVKLVRIGYGDAGTYVGTIVYGRRSHVIVEYSGERIKKTNN